VNGRKWGEGDGDCERMKTSRGEVGEGGRCRVTARMEACSLERATSAIAKAAAASKSAADRGGTVLLREGRGRLAEENMVRGGGEAGGGGGGEGGRGGTDGASGVTSREGVGKLISSMNERAGRAGGGGGDAGAGAGERF
jgi:hypothetical protein